MTIPVETIIRPDARCRDGPGLSGLRTTLVLCAFLAIVGIRPSGAQESTDPKTEETAEAGIWREDYEREGMLAVGWARDTDSLAGPQLSYGIRVEADEGPACGTISLSRISHTEERATIVRADLSFWPLWWKWGGVGPLLGVGIENRRHTRENGMGGFLPLGIEIAFWTRSHWHFVMDAEHDFGISSRSRNQLRLSVAFAHPKLTIGPTHD